MKEFKIVASDLDGTFLDDYSNISIENMNAVKALNRKGIMFVPSSGRSFSEIPEEIKNNDDIRYIISSNGAVVNDTVTGESIKMCISKSQLHKVLDILLGYEVHITYRYDGKCYIDGNFCNDSAFEYYNVWKSHERVIKEFGIRVENFKETLYALVDAEMLVVFFHSEEERLMCKKRLIELGFLSIAEASDNNLEITSKNAGKGNALYKLADKLGVSYSDTIAVGDSDNDSSIIKAAGLGLAVSNAREKLKDIADEVICSNNEHAIDYILSHYID